MKKKELQLDEIKKAELEILEYVDKICKEKNINYYLSGGTLLGAIRHKGFIPWDDDIDIFMPRDDYMKLIKVFRDNNDGNDYKCFSLYSKDDYYYPFAKIVDENTILDELDYERKIEKMGINIDVFPVDGLPKNKLNIKISFIRIYILRIFLSLSLSLTKPSDKKRWKFAIKYPLWTISKLFGWRYFSVRIDNIAQRYKFDHSNKVACLVWGYREREIVSKSIFDKSIDVNFEGKKFPAPIGYDEYLTNLYGDYMELPPIDKRVTHHNFKAYYKNNY